MADEKIGREKRTLDLARIAGVPHPFCDHWAISLEILPLEMLQRALLLMGLGIDRYPRLPGSGAFGMARPVIIDVRPLRRLFNHVPPQYKIKKVRQASIKLGPSFGVISLNAAWAQEAPCVRASRPG